MALHLSDLGGEAAVSEAERSIIRRASTLTVELERLESTFATAGEADPATLDLYQRTAGNLRRLLESIGLERRSRSLTPTIDQYLHDRAARTTVSAAETIPATDGVRTMKQSPASAPEPREQPLAEQADILARAAADGRHLGPAGPIANAIWKQVVAEQAPLEAILGPPAYRHAVEVASDARVCG